ncbi:MAG TPA: cysteine--tRNA ligase [Candidatus Saccharimonadales bacterium]|jgi:cysteinyl-tRNA synthetase|nr:cysteine--tRNA ligase [Candidatus Saccharimonadales bacterium]
MSIQPILNGENTTTKAVVRFHNTMSGETEPFVPLVPGVVRTYTCGPTVYDFAHIGNFRTFVFQDVLRRYLKSKGYRVIQVMNLTDVDDRIIQKAAAAGVSIREYTDKYIQAFLDDRAALNLELPEHLARATEHIDEMVKLIQELTEKGYTYTSEGSTYYRIAKFPEYGKLSKIDVAGMQDGARVDNDRYDKDSARDFALWKAPKPGEHFWETPIGPGRPGWHIECAAMALKFLGDTLDIHSGGVDLTFPHHENEIAESEAATGKTFARYWLHAEFLLVDHEKMSKSMGNFATLRELFSHGHKPSSIRFLLASVPYRRQLNFTPDSLTSAASSVERLRNFVSRLRTEKFPEGSSAGIVERVEKAMQEFDSGLADDLNTAQALAAIFDLVREVNIAMDRGEFRQGDVAPVIGAMEKFDQIFAVLQDDDAEKLRALGIGGDSVVPSDAEVEALVAERQAARKRRDFAASDRLRDELAARGVLIEDSRDGSVRWKRK